MTEEENGLSFEDPCIKDSLLRKYILGKIEDLHIQSIIKAHLVFCSKCYQRSRTYRREYEDETKQVRRYVASFEERVYEKRMSELRGPEPGTVWSTVPHGTGYSGPLILILEKQISAKGEKFLAAEIFEEENMAIHSDMLLQPGLSYLNFRCMVRAGNIFEVAEENLKDFVGELPSILFSQILNFCKKHEEFDQQTPLSGYVFMENDQGIKFMQRRGVTSGLLITRDDDPRLEAFRNSQENCAYLSEPVEGSEYGGIYGRSFELGAPALYFKIPMFSLGWFGALWDEIVYSLRKLLEGWYTKWFK